MKIQKGRWHIIEYSYLVLLGLIAFSRFGSYLLVDVFNLPFYIIELYFIPFFVCNINKYYKLIKKAVLLKTNFCLLSITFLVMVIGIIYTSDFIGMITMTRSIVYILLVYGMFITKKEYTILKMMVVSGAAVVGEIIYGFMFTSSGELASINIICLAMSLIIPAIQGKIWLFIIFTFIGMIASISSGFRVGVILVVLVVLELLVWVVFNKNSKLTKKRFVTKIVILAALFALLYLVINNYDDILNWTADTFGMSQFMYYRLSARINGILMLDFKASQDTGRFSKMYLIISTFIPRILPRGLVMKSLGHLGQYIDVPMLYLYDAFGSIGGWAIFSICFVNGIKNFMGAFKKDLPEYLIVSGLMFPVFIFCFVFNGSFLYITYECILTGIIIAGWFVYGKNAYQVITLNKKQ